MDQLFIIGLLSFVAVLAVSLIMVIIVISIPTKGAKIEEYKKPNKALLVIDVQEDTTGKTARSPFPYANSRELVKNINKATEEALKKGYLLIFIKEVFPNMFLYKIVAKNRLIEGTDGIALDSGLRTQKSKAFEKTKGDAFSSKKLNEYLIENSINEVHLAGVDAKMCVYKTAVGAINRGYKVSLLKDCIATLNTEDMEKILLKFRKIGVELVEKA